MIHAPLAITMGEPAGIGAEITLKAWLIRNELRLPAFYLIADPAQAARDAKSQKVPLVEISNPEDALEHFERGLPILPQPLEEQVKPGQPSPANAAPVLTSIERAVNACLSGTAAAVVTPPIHKATLYRAGFGYPGHTEYLAALCRITSPPVMMLSCPELRTVPVTVHQSLRNAISDLTTDLILETARTTAASLERWFGLKAPRLAITGVNPHAGEDGAMGDEEQKIVQPAIDRLSDEGMRVSGPHAADSLFHTKARKSYDVALCMYHDQALIPIKTLGFDVGVNTTLGLPIVRTSPDHGTALAIAGRGVASPDSMIAAIQQAARMAAADA